MNKCFFYNKNNKKEVRLTFSKNQRDSCNSISFKMNYNEYNELKNFFKENFEHNFFTFNEEEMNKLFIYLKKYHPISCNHKQCPYYVEHQMSEWNEQ